MDKKLVEKLFKHSIKKRKIDNNKIDNIEFLSGDASHRRYYRIFSEKLSFVACLDNPVKKGELPFVITQKIFKENGIRVPVIYDSISHEGYCLQEDLTDTTLIKKLIFEDTSIKELNLYKKCIDLLIGFQRISKEKYQNFDFTKKMFDKDKLQSEVEFTYKYFVEKQMNHHSEKDKKIVLKGLGKINGELAKERMVVAHRDFHSRNIMVKDKELVVVDFQDARMGLPQYDLVSLLEDCYYQLNEKNKDLLVKYYLEQFSELKKWQSEQKFEYLYDLSTLQRVFKAIGSFSYLFLEKEKSSYLRHVGFAFEKIRHLLCKYPCFKEMKRVLAGIFYAN